MSGNAKAIEALSMTPTQMRTGRALVDDQGYDEERFVKGLREIDSPLHPGVRRSTRLRMK
jgi:hypothetical protein